MKNIDIKEMNAKQRLEFATWKTKFYGRETLLEIIEKHKYSFESNKKHFELWFKVTLNICKMKGITFIGKYNLLM